MPTTGIELTTAAEVAPTLIDDGQSVVAPFQARLIELEGHISGLERELEQTKEALDRSRAGRYFYQLFSQGCCCFWSTVAVVVLGSLTVMNMIGFSLPCSSIQFLWGMSNCHENQTLALAPRTGCPRTRTTIDSSARSEDFLAHIAVLCEAEQLCNRPTWARVSVIQLC
jgi:hypothetical protein